MPEYGQTKTCPQQKTSLATINYPPGDFCRIPSDAETWPENRKCHKDSRALYERGVQSDP